jgi:hypothetical protein
LSRIRCVHSLSIAANLPANISPTVFASSKTLKARLYLALIAASISRLSIPIVTFVVPQVYSVSAYLPADVWRGGTTTGAEVASLNVASGVTTITRFCVAVVAPHLTEIDPISANLLAFVMALRVSFSAEVTLFSLALRVASITIYVVAVVALEVIEVK